MIRVVRDVDVLIWVHGISRPLAYTYMGTPEVLARDAIGRGSAVALGPSDYVTAECELWGDWDGQVGLGEPVARCRHAQEQAWDAWRDAASPEMLEIADTLAEDWSLSQAALAETAELLAELNGGEAG